ncbi:hypothetical protein [Bhargavaea massiliensis]|uniref:hypothetical protein n=1 Tax=Bhargavaea massiliensis TaxID=2697500 RepID=UPI001BD11F8D|nr:hypothetical protein [Bhargavaea massiliensis]
MITEIRLETTKSGALPAYIVHEALSLKGENASTNNLWSGNLYLGKGILKISSNFNVKPEFAIIIA